jgi:hypothetical protein
MTIRSPITHDEIKTGDWLQYVGATDRYFMHGNSYPVESVGQDQITIGGRTFSIASRRRNYPAWTRGSAPMQDWSRENPSLHRLYVSSAVEHLQLLYATRKKLYRFSNTNVLDAASDIHKNIVKLCRENAAYRDAAALLYARDEEALHRLEAERSEDTAEVKVSITGDPSLFDAAMDAVRAYFDGDAGQESLLDHMNTLKKALS